MSRRLIRRSAILSLACAGLLCGCYYDPYTGYSYPYPPPAAGYPPPGPYGAGGPGPQAEGGYGPSGYEAGPPPGAANPGEAPPAGYGQGGYGGPGGYAAGGPSAATRLVTREEFIRRAERRAARTNQDPQRAAQRASRQFDQIDFNHSGVVTQEQIREWRAAHRHAPSQPPPQPG